MIHCLKNECERNAHPPALPLRKGHHPPEGSPPLDTLAAQFAPQGNQAERNRIVERNCRPAIGHRLPITSVKFWFVPVHDQTYVPSVKPRLSKVALLKVMLSDSIT